jgi:hypothetical protein
MWLRWTRRLWNRQSRKIGRNTFAYATTQPASGLGGALSYKITFLWTRNSGEQA